jgi:organic radical activating enzyme
MEKGFVGEIFSSVQGEGLYVGRRQVFVRFAGCGLSCIYCDTPEFRRTGVRWCRIERKAGSDNFEKRPNPLKSSDVFREILRLTTPDIHSVSLTGGEPLLAGDFAAEIARLCRRASLPVYLETNGESSRLMKKIVKYVDYAAVDIKLPEHMAIRPELWEHLLEEEISCVRMARDSGVETFVKIVALVETKEETVFSVCRRLSELDVPLVIQPVTPAGKIRKRPNLWLLLKLSEAAARAGVREVAIVPQVHKTLGFR